jgi:putative intracellular protease/amidase
VAFLDPSSFERPQAFKTPPAMAIESLATFHASHQLINEFYAANNIISSVCHGPGALAKAKLPNGKFS